MYLPIGVILQEAIAVPDFPDADVVIAVMVIILSRFTLAVDNICIGYIYICHYFFEATQSQ